VETGSDLDLPYRDGEPEQPPARRQRAASKPRNGSGEDGRAR
jgi:hypothetical protein